MGNYSLQKNIFELDPNKGSCAVFKIFPDEAVLPLLKTDSSRNIAISKLPRWISLSGGALLNTNENDPYAIPIVDFHWYVDDQKCAIPTEDELPHDHFNSSFIYDAYMKGSFKDLDLNKYRVGKSSLLNYDANLILKRKLSWKQLVQTEPVTQNVTLRKTVGGDTAEVKPRTRSKTAVPDEASDDGPVPDKNHSHRITNTHSSPKTVSCNSPKRTLKHTLGNTASPIRSRNRFPNSTTKISAPAPASASTLPNGQNATIGSTLAKVEDEREVSPDSDSSSSSSTSNDRGRKRALPISSQKGIAKIRRLEYTIDDGQNILDYICRNNMHPYTKGNQIWLEMSEDKITDHTAQSMKEHFRRKVYPRKYTLYQCSSADRKKFELAEAAVAEGRRIPLYTPRDTIMKEERTMDQNRIREPHQNKPPLRAFRFR